MSDLNPTPVVVTLLLPSILGDTAISNDGHSGENALPESAPQATTTITAPFVIAAY